MLKTISIFLITICYITDPTKSKAPGPFYKDFSASDRKLSHILTNNYLPTLCFIRNVYKERFSQLVKFFINLRNGLVISQKIKERKGIILDFLRNARLGTNEGPTLLGTLGLSQ